MFLHCPFCNIKIPGRHFDVIRPDSRHIEMNALGPKLFRYFPKGTFFSLEKLPISLIDCGLAEADARTLAVELQSEKSLVISYQELAAE